MRERETSKENRTSIRDGEDEGERDKEKGVRDWVKVDQDADGMIDYRMKRNGRAERWGQKKKRTFKFLNDFLQC